MNVRSALVAIVAVFMLGFVGESARAQSLDLKPGDKVTDSQGRTVENKDAAGSGTVIKVPYTGTKSGSGQNIEVSGPIGLIRNPASNGAKNVEISTAGQATEIKLEKDGSAGSNVLVAVNGGNATITVTADHNKYTVGGAGNTVSVSGDNSTGGGADATSGGTVTHTSSANNNSFTSNGGNWTVIQQ